MIRYDIVIIGGGPAGAVTAWKSDPDKSVLIIEKKQDKTEEKCCGGMLDPTAQQAIAHLGLSLPENVLASPQVFGVRAVDFESRMERFYQRNYLNIHRSELDRYLLEKALERPNVTLWQGARAIRFRQEADQVILTVEKGQETLEVTADILIGADGAASMVRRELLKAGNPKGYRPPKVYVSIQEWHRVEEPLPYYMALFDERVTDFYGWVIPKAIPLDRAIPYGKGSEELVEEILVGAAMPVNPKLPSPEERFRELKEDLTVKGFDLTHPVKRRGAMILRPRAYGSVYTGRGRVFLVGEAAGLISPSSSEGISYALRSGEALARAHFSRKAYERGLSGMKRSIFFKSFKAPLMYHKIWRRLIFWSRLTSLPVDQGWSRYREGRWR